MRRYFVMDYFSTNGSSNKGNPSLDRMNSVVKQFEVMSNAIATNSSEEIDSLV